MANDPVFEVPADLHDQYDDFAKFVANVGSRIPRTHCFGTLNLWPKASGFEGNHFFKNKFRPLGDYSKHRMRKIMSICCKCLMFATRRIAKSEGVEIHSVCAMRQVQDKMHNYNNNIK